MNWRPILTHLAWLVALGVVVEAGAIWACSHWFWTPIQRHYLAAYIWCSLPVITPASAEVRFIWKTARHRKRELASDDDADDSEDGTGMALSQSARDAGWKTLIEGPPREVPAAILKRGLSDLAFDGESLWSFLLLPEACGLVAFGYGLYGCFHLSDRLLDWAVERSLKYQRSPWEEPSPSVFDQCTEAAQRLYSCIVTLHRRTQRRTARHTPATVTNATTELPTKAFSSFPIPFFGLNDGTATGGYLWSEKDEIE